MNDAGMGNWRGPHMEVNASVPHSGGPIMTPADAYRAAHGSILKLQQGLIGHEEQVMGVVHHIHSLVSVIESLRKHYETVVEERDYIKRTLEEAEERLKGVQRLLQRYTSVNDPVVASDGYTYEREAITSYLEECQSMNNVPVSQQTGEELTMMLLPNRSFQRFLSQLMDAKPVEGRHSSGSSGNSKTNATAINTGSANGQNTVREEIGGEDTSAGPNSERLHPCIRVYGYCNYKDSCAYALYPYDACLSHLKGKCRFRSQCHERHVDFRGQLNQGDAGGDTRGGG
ncbi:RNA binding protein, putative [Trypanosoma brucei brucei TREU927]|uniref:RNA binding protein, putative n=1 Tax=Trypanosoma brucei brucei (strain 927/4 GUTat10.1) TaxID=185431 RepID=Q388B3_TRYB2|nr:uncharacterized protein Tb10.61.1690 [Trypanosoma brucei brucei TREU927]EAN78859.1 RNA binding protein, putative [Trypanosoma brucei brucei TREU927]